jgi:hypothetical protein
MGVFDQAARYGAKIDPPGFFRWLLPQADVKPEFRGFLDTRTIPFPGEPDRICDTVAQFGYEDPELPAVACVTDFQTEPESDILERLLEYGIRVRRELRQDHQGRVRKFDTVTALTNLTGNPQPATWDMHPAGFGGAGQSFKVILRTMSAENAVETLDGIEAGRIARCLLPWIPLMTGGNEARIIERWKQIAATEPESRRRADYAGLALVFSELTGGRAVWKRALEGWNMRESQQVLEWQAEALKEGWQGGLHKGRMDTLLDVVRYRFGSPVPDDLIAQIKGLTDDADISRWLEAAAKCDTLEQFQTRVNGRS